MPTIHRGAVLRQIAAFGLMLPKDRCAIAKLEIHGCAESIASTPILRSFRCLVASDQTKGHETVTGSIAHSVSEQT